MKVFELMDELIEELESSPKTLFSNKRSVDLGVVSEIIADLKNALPAELEEATQILRERDEILAAAREEAASIIKSAEDELNSRVCEESVMQEAEARAKQLLALSQTTGIGITQLALLYLLQAKKLQIFPIFRCRTMAQLDDVIKTCQYLDTPVDFADLRDFE
mgnify:CR=1 FL=1